VRFGDSTLRIDERGRKLCIAMHGQALPASERE
jgi:hypothetical protein